MTTDVLRVSGDYKIEANASNSTSVTIDTPLTIVTGNLNILGTFTNITSTNTNIKDNIVVLNSGETNNYVTLDVSGILIARGANDSISQAATFLYNDNTSSGGVWSVGTVTNRGLFEFKVEQQLSGIRVNAIRAGAGATALNLLGSDNPTAVLSVAGTTNYEDQILDDDDIPNKKYVDSAIYSETSSTRKLQVGNNFIEINSSNVNITDEFFSTTDRIFAALNTETNIVFNLEGTEAQFLELNINNNRIYVNTTTNQDLILETNQGFNVNLKNPLSLLKTPSPTGKINEIMIYSTSTVGGGGTGLYYVNDSNTDELISRRKAIIYGIIF
jgi:hypothetical protein